MNNNQPPFNPAMMFAGLPPFLQQLMMQQQQVSHVIDIPARVRVALEYLQFLAFKQMTRAAVNDMSIEQIPGQDTTPKEESARSAACAVLEEYFDGELEKDVYEEEPQENNITRGEKGVILDCIYCVGRRGKPESACRVCRGTGVIVVYSVLGQNSQNEGS